MVQYLRNPQSDNITPSKRIRGIYATKKNFNVQLSGKLQLKLLTPNNNNDDSYKQFEEFVKVVSVDDLHASENGDRPSQEFIKDLMVKNFKNNNAQSKEDLHVQNPIVDLSLTNKEYKISIPLYVGSGAIAGAIIGFMAFSILYNTMNLKDSVLTLGESAALVIGVSVILGTLAAIVLCAYTSYKFNNSKKHTLETPLIS